VYAPNRKYLRVDYTEGPGVPDGWVVERKSFDKWLAGEAAKAGAKVLAKTDCLALLKEDGKVAGARLKHRDEEWDVKARIVIAADGVESKVAREAGINTTLNLNDIASCAQFEMAGVKIDPDRIEIYFDQDLAPGGYFWIFPKSESSANVGIGVRKPFSTDIAYNYLKKFIDTCPGLKDGSIIEVNSGGVPVGGLMKDMATDNFMVVGDAAHQANPIHGGGISEAFVGGRNAGEVAVEAIKAGDTSRKFLSRYNKRWWDERGNLLMKVFKLRTVVESMSNEDLDWLASELRGEDILEFSRAKQLKILANVLLKRPKLAFLARKLL
jgi:digeranylgeranylglycerophospholipid reductase